MSAFEEMSVNKTNVSFGDDAVVIRQYNGGITGGRALDYTDFTDDVIKAGHIVVRKKNEDGVYEYKPLKVTSGSYAALGDGEEYAGVVVRSRMKGEAVAIMDDGRVNDEAMPYPIDDTRRAALKTALPNLIFEHD